MATRIIRRSGKKESRQAEAQSCSILLTLMKKGKTIRSSEFQGAEVCIGRNKTAHFRVEDTFVSGVHCILQSDGGKIFLVDNKSTNGTIVNGRQINDIEIQDGDEIQLGKSTVLVQIVKNGNQIKQAEVEEKTVRNRPQPKPEKKVEEPKSNLQEEMENWISQESIQAEPLLPDHNRSITPEELGLVDPDEDDEIEEYEKNFVTPFSMTDKVLSMDKKSSGRRTERVLEVVQSIGDTVQTVQEVENSKGFRVFSQGQRFKIASSRGMHGFEIFFRDDFEGEAILNGREISLRELARSAQPMRRGFLRATLSRDDQVTIRLPERTYHFRYVDAQHLPASSFRPRLSPWMAKTIGVSFLTHVIAIAIVTLFAARVDAEYRREMMEDKIDRFASLDTSDLEPPKPKPTPAPPKKSVSKPKPPKMKVRKSRKIRTAKKRSRNKSRVAVRSAKKLRGGPGKTPSAPRRNVHTAGVLAALSGSGSGRSVKSTALSAVTNLHAVKAKGGVQTFSVSGLMGKIDSDDVSIIRVADLKTKGTGRAGGRNYGMLAALGGKGKGGGGPVQGLVVGEDPVIEPMVKGGLTREQIAKIVAAHVAEISYCYEKGLLEDPALAGKIMLMWIINSRGKVTSSRIKSSSLRNGQVHSCLARSVRSWRFPNPKGGGIVEVNYPFVFNNAGF
jgi:pSer/pThr/pTyr-binding forkhead associated (FHA) protein